MTLSPLPVDVGSRDRTTSTTGPAELCAGDVLFDVLAGIGRNHFNERIYAESSPRWGKRRKRASHDVGTCPDAVRPDGARGIAGGRSPFPLVLGGLLATVVLRLVEDSSLAG
jgi:hypothetical protein